MNLKQSNDIERCIIKVNKKKPKPKQKPENKNDTEKKDTCTTWNKWNK